MYAKTLSATQIEQARTVFIFIIVYLSFSFLTQTLTGITLAYENFLFGSIRNIARTVLKTLCLSIVVMLFQTAYVIAVIDEILGILMFFATMRYIKKRYGFVPRIGKMDKDIIKASAPLCFALFLQTIVNQANNNVDKFVLGVAVSPESVALYSVAMYVYSIFSYTKWLNLNVCRK